MNQATVDLSALAERVLVFLYECEEKTGRKSLHREEVLRVLGCQPEELQAALNELHERGYIRSPEQN